MRSFLLPVVWVVLACHSTLPSKESTPQQKEKTPISPTKQAGEISSPVVEPWFGGRLATDQSWPKTEALPVFNRRVIELAQKYPIEGSYTWPAEPPGTHGVTQDLFLGKKKIAKASEGSHCVGITFEVFWRALLLQPGGAAGAGLDEKQAKDLLRLWFVPDLGGRGVAEALPLYRLGKVLPAEEALPGDFVQAWMFDGSGHSFVFVGWVYNESQQRVGVRYWSSQPWTDGIGIAEHPIGEGGIDMSQFYVARALP